MIDAACLPPQWWGEVLFQWGVDAKSQEHIVAPRVTSLEAWMELKWDPGVPFEVKKAIASMEVAIVHRMPYIDAIRSNLMIAKPMGERELNVYVLSVLCAPELGRYGHNLYDIVRHGLGMWDIAAVSKGMVCLAALS